MLLLFYVVDIRSDEVSKSTLPANSDTPGPTSLDTNAVNETSDPFSDPGVEFLFTMMNPSLSFFFDSQCCFFHFQWSPMVT